MSRTDARETVLREVNLIPEDKLFQVYELLHYFRLDLEAARDKTESVMQFAGCWEDMPDETFAAFTQKVAERRQGAFSRRRNREGGID